MYELRNVLYICRQFCCKISRRKITVLLVKSWTPILTRTTQVGLNAACELFMNMQSCVSLLTCSISLSALNAQAALSQVRERQLATQALPETNGASSSEPPLSITGQPRPEHCEGAASGLRGLPPAIQSTPISVPTASSNFLPPATPALQTAPPSGSVGNTLNNHPALSSAEEAVLHKLRWATQELQHAVSVEASIQLCSLIRGCAESLRSLKELQL